MSGLYSVGWILAGTLVLFLLGLAFFVMGDKYISRKHRKIMSLVIACIFGLIVQNFVEFILTWQIYMPRARVVASIWGYSLRPVILMLFFYIVNEKRNYVFFWLLVGINAAVHMTALFSPICFKIDVNNNFRRGPLGYCCHIVSGILLLYLFYLTLKEYRFVRRRDLGVPLFNVLLISASVRMDSALYIAECPISYLTIAVVACSLFYYIWLHLQFAAEHERALMAEQRIQIMMTQIQPHFLYNTLSTIQALCRIDPEKAAAVTAEFGTYLRQNLDSLGQTDLVPVWKELEHTKVYTEIEGIRFPHIHVEYDTPDTGFSLPALTIQPIVENAIRHGGWNRRDGLVSVVIRREVDHHEIIIKDNGKGFEMQMAEHTDETHIGIRNVRERIEKMCGGTLTVDSVVGEGTTVTIRVPASTKHEETEQEETKYKFLKI